MQDTIADFFTRLRNALAAKKESVTAPSSKQKIEIAKLLKSEGYIDDFSVLQEKKKPFLKVDLKYYGGEPAIVYLRRVSKPGLRVYSHAKALSKVASGLGVVVVSTSKGIMTGRHAYKANLGGEVVCEIF